MKNNLDENSRKEIIRYRLEKSERNFQEAEILAANHMFDAAVTRLYYSCFHSASALLIANQIECGSHRGIKTMLSLHFVNKGILDRRHIRSFSGLLNGRQLSDYEDFIYQDSESYQTFKQQTLEFNKAIEALLNP